MKTKVVAGLAAVGFVVLPIFLGTYGCYLATMWLIFALSAIGLNVPLGLTSLYSFGHGSFMLIGAYTTAIGITNWGLAPLLAMALALIIAAAVGVLVGLPALRLSGFPLAIATFSFAFMLFHLVKGFDFTGGPQGITVPHIAFARLFDGRAFYYAVLLVFAVGVAFYVNISSSQIGRALRTVGYNEIVAQSLGINLVRYKLFVFVVSSIYAAAAGALMVPLTSYIAPETFSPELSVNLFAAVMIGGMGTVSGPVLGALFIVLIPELTQFTQNLGSMIYAVLFCLVAVALPKGLVSLWTPVGRSRAQIGG